MNTPRQSFALTPLSRGDKARFHQFAVAKSRTKSHANPDSYRDGVRTGRGLPTALRYSF